MFFDKIGCLWEIYRLMVNGLSKRFMVCAKDISLGNVIKLSFPKFRGKQNGMSGILLDRSFPALAYRVDTFLNR